MHGFNRHPAEFLKLDQLTRVKPGAYSVWARGACSVSATRIDTVFGQEVHAMFQPRGEREGGDATQSQQS